MKKYISEPLVHFLIIGLLLYLYSLSMTKEDEIEQTKKTITTTPQEVEQIKLKYKQLHKKYINNPQLDAYIIKNQYEKILLNEAYSLNLHKQSETIKNTLLKQMDYILTTKVKEPTEKELLAYYKQNLNDYSHVEELSFKHIYFKYKTSYNSDEVYNLIQLVKIDPNSAHYFGDIIDKPMQTKNISYDKARKIYGNYFAIKLFDLKQGVWSSSIQSTFGTHLIYVDDKKSSIQYTFEEVQDRVYDDYMFEHRLRNKQNSYNKIIANYNLEVIK